MLANLLKTIPEGGKDIGFGEAGVYAIVGFIVVFLGIAILIAIVWAVGLLMAKFNNRQANKAVSKVAPVETVSAKIEEEIPEETVAIIMAALMAYYEKNNPKCEFTVKRIKRI